jgi:type IV pilus assembly protein PilV
MTNPLQLFRRQTADNAPHAPRTGWSSGFSLVEVLVALVVLSVGLAGLAALILTGIKSNDGALVRTQATTLAYDIIDRMRANRGALGISGTALDGAYDDVSISHGDSALSSGNMAQTDLAQWQQALTASSLPNWTAGVRRLAGNLFTVAVQWDDRRAQDPNEAAATSCLDDNPLPTEMAQVCVTTQL